MNTLSLVTGGARSGKSAHALDLALKFPGPRVFLATATPFDSEMEARISAHKNERGDEFMTVEEPFDPAGAIIALSPETGVVLMDCLTVWLGNLLHRDESRDGEYPEIRRFLELLESPPFDLVLVTNEVGSGIVPENRLARKFRDLAGFLNQKTAQKAHRVFLCACGIPILIKGEKL